MKIAGRKNDGAWFRTNKAIRVLDNTGRADLISAALESLNLKASAVITDLQALAAECGVTMPGEFESPTTWITKLMTYGIPRQVWNGHLTFTTYAKVGTKFVANYQTQLHFFAKDLRRFMKYWLLGKRQMADLSDLVGGPTVNPGGNPDASRPDIGA